MAGSGVGKTTCLINFGMAAALHGARVLHISFELNLQPTLHRYYRRIAEANRGEFFSNIAGVEARVNHYLKLAKGGIDVLYLPAYSHTTQDVKLLVDLYTETHGGLDVLILDYLDLLTVSGAQSKFSRPEQLMRQSHEIRSICSEHEATVLTATQATRAGADADQLRMSHIAGSVGKFQAADIVLGLAQSDELEEIDQAVLGLLKMRENPGRGELLPLALDLDLMYIGDLDSHDSRRLRQGRVYGQGRQTADD